MEYGLRPALDMSLNEPRISIVLLLDIIGQLEKKLCESGTVAAQTFFFPRLFIQYSDVYIIYLCKIYRLLEVPIPII